MSRHNARARDGERCNKCDRRFGWREYIGRDDDGLGSCRNMNACQATIDRLAMHDHAYERDAYAPPKETR